MIEREPFYKPCTKVYVMRFGILSVLNEVGVSKLGPIYRGTRLYIDLGEYLPFTYWEDPEKPTRVLTRSEAMEAYPKQFNIIYRR